MPVGRCRRFELKIVVPINFNLLACGFKINGPTFRPTISFNIYLNLNGLPFKACTSTGYLRGIGHRVIKVMGWSLIDIGGPDRGPD
jgi:hypothetical protein